MRKLIVSEFISLDGVVEDPGGAEGFEGRGWNSPYWNDELAAYKRDELLSADRAAAGARHLRGLLRYRAASPA